MFPVSIGDAILAPVIFPRVRSLAQGVLPALVVALLLAAPVPAARSSVHENQRPSAAEFESLSLTRSRQNHLLIHAYINGKPARLIVDSGSPSTVISAKRRAHFGLTAAPENLNWPTEVQVNGRLSPLVIARNLRLGRIDVVDAPVVLVDLGQTRRAYRVAREQEADGILGADVLFATKAILDCRRQMLVLNLYPETPSEGAGLDFRGFQQVPLFVTEGLNSYVDGTVNGTPARLMVDTGAFDILLHRSFVRRLRIPLRKTRLESAAINLSYARLDLAQIQKLSIGLVNIVGKKVGVTDLSGFIDPDQKSTPPVVGLLGGEILRTNHAIIDFGTRTLYLKTEGEVVAARDNVSKRSRVSKAEPVLAAEVIR